MRFGRDAHSTVLLATLLYCHAWSQDTQRAAPYESADSVTSRNGGNILFTRNLNTLTWVGRAVIDTAGSGAVVRLNELYQSNVVLLEGSPSACWEASRTSRCSSVNR